MSQKKLHADLKTAVDKYKTLALVLEFLYSKELHSAV